MSDRAKVPSEELERRLADCPAAGTLWTHTKSGRRYRVTGRAVLEATLEPLVLYQPAAGPDSVVWARPLAAWRELVSDDQGRRVPRFQPASGGGREDAGLL
jgi:hypothetical protein